MDGGPASLRSGPIASPQGRLQPLLRISHTVGMLPAGGGCQNTWLAALAVGRLPSAWPWTEFFSTDSFLLLTGDQHGSLSPVVNSTSPCTVVSQSPRQDQPATGVPRTLKIPISFQPGWVTCGLCLYLTEPVL